MSTKKSHSKTSGIKWPKTQEAQRAELEKRQHAIGTVATVGQLMTAASAVPMPRSRKLLSDAAAEASKGALGSGRKGKKGKKRAWQEHAEEYFANNSAWDEVNGIYQGCLDLLRTSLALTPLLREVELLNLVVDKRLLTRNVSAITRDTQVLAQELTAIRKTHDEKSGGSKDQADMMESCAVFSQYVQFMERYDSALMPLVVHASEQLQEALLILETINPALAQALSNNLQNTLRRIQGIVHDLTGADEVETPTQQPAQETAVAETAV